jgi:hypothetical protein
VRALDVLANAPANRMQSFHCADLRNEGIETCDSVDDEAEADAEVDAEGTQEGVMAFRGGKDVMDVPGGDAGRKKGCA